MDLSIEGTIYRNGAYETAVLGITDGKISAIKKTLKTETHFNFGTKLILPAGIDLHVHFRDPGHTNKEDIHTGSTAAAFGGITTVFDMPNTTPPTTTLTTLREKQHTAQRRSLIDIGLYCAVTETNLDKLPNLAPHCAGFKIFLGASTNAVSLPSTLLQQALATIQPTHARTLIHAEDERCLDRKKGTETSLADHNRRRPPQCEEVAIQTVLETNSNTPIHICHLSSNIGLTSLVTHPASLTIGVTPHHLLLDSTMGGVHPAWLKVNPPIRTPLDREALWNAMVRGDVTVLESDHAPHTLDEKDVEFSEAPSGMPGVETMYPLFLALVKQERLSLDRLLSLLCEQPAELAHLSKGRLEVGRDADLIVVDFKQEMKVISDRLHSKCGWSAFEGFPAVFPSAVFLRGDQLIDEGQLVGSPGSGFLIKNAGAAEEEA